MSLAPALPNFLQRPRAQTGPAAIRKINRPGLRPRHDHTHDRDSNFLPGDVDDNDLRETGLSHPLDDEFDVVVDGWMPIGRDIVEADGMAAAVLRFYRRRPPGWNEVRQILPAALDAGQAGLCGLGQRAGQRDPRIRMSPASAVRVHARG